MPSDKLLTADELCKAQYDRERFFIKDPDERKRRYALYFEAMPINKKAIFYESMGGTKMMDSPFAIFKFVYGDERFKDYMHIWSISSYDIIPDEFKNKDNVIFVTRDTDIYMRWLASSAYVIGNSVYPDYFVRRPDQKYLNTWHGIAYKRVGRSHIAPLGGYYAVYNLLQATHLLTPCDFMSGIQLNTMGMGGVYSGTLAETGYPRIDLTIGLSAEAKAAVAHSVGIDTSKKTILYAPTWRSSEGENVFDTERLAEDLKLLSDLGANVIFLGHHLMTAHIRGLDLGSVKIPPANANTNELLAISDIIITDYSSIFFDFLVTDRPIIHYMYDYEEYFSTRGLNLEIGDLPGDVVHDAQAMVAAVSAHLKAEASQAVSEKYRRAKERFCPHEDGQASRRASEWFFFDDTSGVAVVAKPEKKNIVFWGGRLDGTKKTNDFLEQVRLRAQDAGSAVSLIVARGVEKNKAAMDVIRNLDSSITIIARAAHGTVSTIEEDEARGALDSGNDRSPSARHLHARLYEREYRRVMGEARFAESIEFSGNSRFWKEFIKAGKRISKSH